MLPSGDGDGDVQQASLAWMHPDPQGTNPGAHSTPHTPFVHVAISPSPALGQTPLTQSVLHDPQANGQLERSRQPPKHIVLSGGHSVTHPASEQTVPAGHTFPHAMQLVGASNGVSHPLLGSPSQSAHSAAHATSAQAPLEHPHWVVWRPPPHGFPSSEPQPMSGSSTAMHLPLPLSTYPGGHSSSHAATVLPAEPPDPPGSAPPVPAFPVPPPAPAPAAVPPTPAPAAPPAAVDPEMPAPEAPAFADEPADDPDSPPAPDGPAPAPPGEPTTPPVSPGWPAVADPECPDEPGDPPLPEAPDAPEAPAADPPGPAGSTFPAHAASATRVDTSSGERMPRVYRRSRRNAPGTAIGASRAVARPNPAARVT
jgi:hypothetical protein